MQLYIVWFSNFDSQDELMGIYADEENAKRFIEGFDAQEQKQLRIDEYGLDD